MPHAVAITPDGEFTAGDVTPDSLFWLASMTKPVTTLGALRLDLDLDAPVAHYVPDFAHLQVLEGDRLRPRPRRRRCDTCSPTPQAWATTS